MKPRHAMLMLACLAASLVLVGPAMAAPGQIAFDAYSPDSGGREIYTMSASGTGPVQLTNAAGINGWPDWSPDGTKIAFVSDRDGNSEIYVMNADGSGQTRLTSDPAMDDGPAWSPDGTQLAFTSRRDGSADIYIMNADGSGVTNLNVNDPGWCSDREPAWSADGAKIAFISENEDGDSDLYVMNADGTGRTQLTDDAGWNCEPAWSPDGTKIVFTPGADEYLEIDIINPDGTGRTTLTDNLFRDTHATWSPDGTKIAFASDRDGPWGIYTMSPDGSGVTSLGQNSEDALHPDWGGATTPPTAGERIAFIGMAELGGSGFRSIGVMDDTGGNLILMGDDWDNTIANPAWSPDGSRIAYDANPHGGAFSIMVMNADGTGETELTTHDEEGGEDTCPAWSPDGARIAFGSARPEWGSPFIGEICVMNADGTGITRLTTNAFNDGSPAWSPDGSKIAFSSTRNGNQDIYVMDADGTDEKRLTADTALDGSPEWSPDGSRITFESQRSGSSRIYTMRADGTDVRCLTVDSYWSSNPTWSPDGSRIAFSSSRSGVPGVYVMNVDGTEQSCLLEGEAVGDRPAPDWWGVASVNALRTAAFSFSPEDPLAQETVSFTDASTDTDGSIASCAWAFGDGGSATGVTAAHTYTAAGTYTVTLTVTDDDGATDTAIKTVSVQTPAEGTKDLRSLVIGYGLRSDVQKGLTDKLDTVVTSLNAGNKKMAINNLNAFINQVKAQRGKTLTAAQAEGLIAEAQRIIGGI